MRGLDPELVEIWGKVAERMYGMCDEDYWRKEAERLFSLADVAKIKRDFLVFQRDEARHIARVLCKYLRKIEKAYDSSGDYGILDINLHDLFEEAKRELPWL